MANNLINSENLAVIEGYEKADGDSLAERVINLEERIALLEKNGTWIFAGRRQPAELSTPVVLPAGVEPQEFCVIALRTGDGNTCVNFPAIAGNVSTGTKTTRYYIGSASGMDKVDYTVTVGTSGKTYSLVYTGSATIAVDFYYR